MPSASCAPSESPEPFHHEGRRTFIDAGRMYLRLLFELEEEERPGRRTELGARLGVSRPTVGEQLDRLVDDDLVTIAANKVLSLTARGRVRAATVVRKHRLAECFLVDVVGFDWALAHVEASRWQHVMSARAERKIAELLGHPQLSPYGCPIPAAGTAEPVRPVGDGHPVTGRPLIRLVDASGGEAAVVTVRRVPERLQTDTGLLAELRRVGALPGESIRVHRAGPGDEVRIETDAGAVTLPVHVGSALLVEGVRRRLPPRPRRKGTRPAPDARRDRVRGT